VRRLTLLTFLILATCCGGTLSGGPSVPPDAAPPQAVAADTGTSPYRRAGFSAGEVKKLNEELPEEVRQVLEQADEVEVFSISESHRTAALKGGAKSEMLDTFYEGVIHPEPMAGCFKPHHGLRAKSGGREVEIRICFTCKNFAWKWGSAESFGGRMGRNNGMHPTRDKNTFISLQGCGRADDAGR
jgi:hypothetical protein